MADVIQIAIEGTANGLLGAIGQATSGLGQLEGSASKAGAGLQTALGVGVVAAAAGLGAALTGAVSAATDFEKQISGIAAVSGEGVAGINQIRQTALQLGKDTSFSASQAAAGMEEIIKAGLSVQQVVGGAGRAVLDLSAASGTAVEESARIMSNVLNTFAQDQMTAAQAADLLTGAANASATSVHELGYGLASVGNVAATLGLSFKDTNDALALFAQNGLKGSDSGTSLKTMLLNLTPSTKKQTEEMRTLGIITADGANKFFDATGKAKGLAEISEVLKTAMQGLTKEQQISALQTIFGTDAIRAAAIMAKEGAAGFREMDDAVRKQGDAQGTANERLNNLAGSIEILKGSLETGAIILGGMFTPALKSLADMVTGEVNQAVDILQQLPDVVTTIQEVLAGDWSPDASIQPFTNAVGLLAVSFRDNLLPAIMPVIDFVRNQLLPAFAAIAAPLAAGTAAFLGVVGVAGLVTAAVAGVTAVLGLLLSPLGLVALASGALAAAWTVNFGDIQGKTMVLVGIVQQALSGDMAGAFAGLLALIGTTSQQIGAQLLLWGQQFVDWVAPMIPPMLAAAADLGAQLLAWIVAQVPVWTAAFVAWATEWWQWLVVATPLLLAAAAAFVAPLVAWVQAQVPIWTAQLLLWGQEFVAWVAPQIPPLIAAATALGVALLGWIVAEIPILAAQLLLWGRELWAWVQPQIPLMTAQLVLLGKALIDWITAEVPLIVPELVKWGLLFGAWVLTTGIPEMAKALKSLHDNLIQWALDTGAQLAPNMQALGRALVQGIWDGIKGAASEIGPNVVNAVRGMFSGAAPGTTGISGASDAGNFDAKAIAAAQKYGLEDPTGFAAQLRQESGNYDPEVVSGRRKSSAGASGIAQFMPGTAAKYGVDPNNPDAAIEAAARYMADLKAQYGSQREAAARYYGAPGANSIDGQIYQNAIENQRKNVRMPSPSVPQVSQFALGLPPDEAMAACGPAALAWFMNQTGRTPSGTEAEALAASAGWDKQRGMYGAAAFGSALTKAGIPNTVDTTPTAGEVGALAASNTPFAISTGGFTDEFGQSHPGHYYQVQGGSTEGLNVGLSGTALKGGAPTMSLDQIQAMSGPMNAIITLSGQMGDALTVAGQTGATAFDGLLTSATTMSDGSTLAITTMGGQVTATITDAAGQVTGQWSTMTQGITDQTATLATDVPAQAATMATDTLTSVTDLGAGFLTTVQDMSGNTVATVTDMAGQVTSQSATLANGVSLNMADMAAGVMTSVTDLGNGVLTTVTDMSGNTIATVTDLHGNVVNQFTQMAGDGGAAVTNLANISKTEFGAVSSAASSTSAPIRGVNTDLQSIKAPNVKPALDALGSIETAAEQAERAAKQLQQTVSGIGGRAGGSGSSSGIKSGGGKAVGGSVFAGQAYLVGDGISPEVFVPDTNGRIIPRISSIAPGSGSLYMGQAGGQPSGTTITVNLHVEGSVMTEQDLVETVRAGLIDMSRRNGIDILDSGN